MADLAVVFFKVEQTSAQTKLKTVRLAYGYTLTPSAEECSAGTTFDVAVDILGDDLVRDDVLVGGVDQHRLVFPPDSPRLPLAERRELIVGQALLDEDLGTDEIKLRIVATPEGGEPVSVNTPVVRGDF